MKNSKTNGRPPIDGVTRETQSFVKLSIEETNDIKEIADYLNMPKSVFMRNLVLYALDDAKMFKKLGFLSMAKGIKKTSEAIEKLKDIRQKNLYAL